MKTLLEGKMSTFGGPDDTGVGPGEGLAIADGRFALLRDYFLPRQPPNTSGLARRLNPKKYYIACRWNYSETSKDYLASILVTVTNPKNGKSAQAKPVDWGPNASTGRVTDISPGLADFLALNTDDNCVVEIPLPGSEVEAVRRLARDASRHLQVLSESEIKRAFGNFSYKELTSKRGAIVILPPWERDNLVQVTIPQLRGLPHYGTGGFSGKFACHKKVSTAMVDVFAAIDAQGLRDKVIFWGGCHVPRHKSWNPSRGLSSHSWGIAIDINVQWNAYNQPPAPKGAEGSVVELVPIFEAHGFAWGGYFGEPDGMHFEYAKSD